MSINLIAKKILGLRENRMTGYLMSGEVREELGFEGYAEALRRRWIEADMEQSGMVTVTNHLGKVDEIRKLAAECKDKCGNCNKSKCQCEGRCDACAGEKCTCESLLGENIDDNTRKFFSNYNSSINLKTQWEGTKAGLLSGNPSTVQLSVRHLEGWLRETGFFETVGEAGRKQWEGTKAGLLSGKPSTVQLSVHHLEGWLKLFNNLGESEASRFFALAHSRRRSVGATNLFEGAHYDTTPPVGAEDMCSYCGKNPPFSPSRYCQDCEAEGQLHSDRSEGYGLYQYKGLPGGKPTRPRGVPASEAVTPGLGRTGDATTIPAPGLGAQSATPTRQTTPTAQTTGPSSRPEPVSIGRDVTVVEAGKQYVGKVSRTLPDGKYEISFAGEQPPTRRPYDKTEVSAVASTDR